MTSKKKEKRSLPRNEFFEGFAKNFQHLPWVVLYLLIQFACVEIVVFLISAGHQDSLLPYGIRFALVLSGMCYGYSNKACESYINGGGDKKYRKRANRFFWIGLALFALPTILLAVLKFYGQI